MQRSSSPNTTAKTQNPPTTNNSGVVSCTCEPKGGPLPQNCTATLTETTSDHSQSSGRHGTKTSTQILRHHHPDTRPPAANSPLNIQRSIYRDHPPSGRSPTQAGRPKQLRLNRPNFTSNSFTRISEKLAMLTPTNGLPSSGNVPTMLTTKATIKVSRKR